MESTAPDLSVRDVLRAPTTTEFAGVEAFARRVTHRFRPLADTSRGYGDRLSASIEARWTLPRHLDGLDVLDAQGFEDMVHDWQVRRGYDDLVSEDRGPFVVPVDPVEQLGGFSATDAHAGRGRERLRAVAPMARPTPRRAAPTGERWRSAGQGTFSPYPAALGKAGRIDGSLLRFPEARAVVGTNERRALLVDDGPATAWGNVLSFAPAARSAERMAAEAVARTQPATTTPVGVWLERAETPSIPGQSLPAATRAAGRWQSAGLASVVHAPTTPDFAVGRLAQQFLDAPEPTPFAVARSFGAPIGYQGEDFAAERDFLAAPAAAPNPGDTSATPDAPAATPRRRGNPTVAETAAPRPGTPAAIALRTPPATAPAQAPLRTAIARPAAPAAASALLSTAPLFLTPAPRVSLAAGAAVPGAPTTDRSTPALQAPLAGRASDAAFPALTRGAFVPAATRAAAEAESSPLARRLAAEADESPELAHARFDFAPRAPELWSGFDVSDTTLIVPAAATPTSTVGDAGIAVAPLARRRGATAPGAQRSGPPSARTHLLQGSEPEPPGGIALPSRVVVVRPSARPTAAPAPLSRASIAAVVLPTLLHTQMAPVARGMLVPTTPERTSPAARSAGRTLTALAARTAEATQATQLRRTAPTTASTFADEGPIEPGGHRLVAGPSAGPTAAPFEPAIRGRVARDPDAPLTIGTGLSLASARFENIPQGPVAARIADAIASRFPTEEEGPWGPRVVLPGRASRLSEDAPDAELVEPVAASPEVPAVTQAGATPARRPRPAAVSTDAAITARPTVSAAATPARRPTLLSPGRPGLPGALSPVLAERTNPTAASQRAAQLAMGTPAAIASGRQRPATSPAADTTSRSARTLLGRDAAPRTADAPPATARAAARSPFANLGITPPPETTAVASAAGAILGGHPVAAWRATAEAFGPAAVLAELTLRFGLRIEAAAAALGPILGRFRAADAAIDMAPFDAAALTFGRISAAVPNAGLENGTTAPALGRAWSAGDSTPSRLADDAGAGDLFRPTSPDARPLGTPVTAEGAADRSVAAVHPGAVSRSGTRPSPALSRRSDAPDSRSRARAATTIASATLESPAAEFAPGLSAARPMTVISVAGRTLLVPVAMAAALRQSSAEPAVLRALARSGSPALASLLAADAPTGVFLESAATPSATAEPAGRTPAASEAGVTAARRATAAGALRGERALSRVLAAAGFSEPRGLRTAGPALRQASSRRAGSAEPRRESGRTDWAPPSLASLVLPEGITASPSPAARPTLDAFSLGNVDRALVAFDMAAQRNPGAVGESGASGAGTNAASSAMASTLLRGFSAGRSGALGSMPGALASPGAAERGESAPSVVSAGSAEDRALVSPAAPAQKQPVFGNRGPSVSITSPAAPASRVMVDTGARRAGGGAPLRSTDGERPARQAETGEEARHRLAEGQIEESLSPEELDKIAHEVISQLKRQIELDAIRVGEDEWD